MEINTYNLRKNHDELKDLSENTLMAIADLCMDYYKLGQYSAQEDAQSDRQDEIDELQNENDNLSDELRETQDQFDEAEGLIKDCYLSDSISEVKESIQRFSETHGYDYKWDFIEKK